MAVAAQAFINGKTRRAIGVAEQRRLNIVPVDSGQLFKGVDSPIAQGSDLVCQQALAFFHLPIFPEKFCLKSGKAGCQALAFFKHGEVKSLLTKLARQVIAPHGQIGKRQHRYNM